MKTKVVFKKGRYVKTREGKEVIKIARSISRGLKALTYRQEIVGSIRRKLPAPVDVDIVVIAKSREKVVRYLSGKGKYLQGGDKRASFNIKGVKVEVYFAHKKSWGAHLISYTGPFEYSIGLRMMAKRKGYLLNQYGLFKNKKYIAGETEESIYKVFGKKWKEPSLRGK
jgi:DNA polymerase (family 10)